MGSFIIFQQLLKALFTPPFCAYCKELLSDDTVLCRRCMSGIPALGSYQIPLTSTQSLNVFTFSRYKEPLKSLILAKKYSNRVASKQLAHLIARTDFIDIVSIDYFVPVPLHWTRYAWRGYNQAQVMASELAQLSNKPMIELLKRKRKTVFQNSLAINRRADNVKDAFALLRPPESEIEGKHIMLVDDLMTTGSTLRAAAQELLILKPASLNAVVACRAKS